MAWPWPPSSRGGGTHMLRPHGSVRATRNARDGSGTSARMNRPASGGRQRLDKTREDVEIDAAVARAMAPSIARRRQ